MNNISVLKSRIKKKNNEINKSVPIKSMIFLIVFSVAVMLGIYSINYKEIKKINKLEISNDTYISFNDGKEEHGSIKEIFKHHTFKKNDDVTIRMILPKDMYFSNPSLSFQLPNSVINVYLDDKKIYSIGEGKKLGDVVGKGYVKIPIEDKYKGKEVKVCIKVFDTGNINDVRTMNIMNSYDVDLYNIRSQMVNIHISNYIYLFGIVCLILMLRGFWKHFESKRILYIALTSIIGATWIITSTNIGIFLKIPRIIKYYAEYELLYALVYFTLKLFVLSLRDVYQTKYIKILEYLYIFDVLVVNVLKIFNVHYFSETLVWIHAFVFIIAIVLYGLSIKYIKKCAELFVIFSAMIVAIGIYLVMHNLKMIAFLSANNIIAMMIFVMGIFMFFAVILEIRLSYMHKFEREVLINKVYEDEMTKLHNRRSCEKYMKDINDTKESSYIVYSFDINDLKKLNDNFGHEKGDELIKAFSYILKEVFNDTDSEFVGRMGGDEFLVVQKIMEGSKVEECIKSIHLEEKIKSVNLEEKYDFSISYAYGYEVFDKAKESDVWNTYSIADKKMYELKRKMKSKEI